MTGAFRSRGLHFPAPHLASVGGMFPLSCLSPSPWNGATHIFKLGFPTTVFIFCNCPKISIKFFPANFYLGTIVVLDTRRITPPGLCQIHVFCFRVELGRVWTLCTAFGWALHWRLISWMATVFGGGAKFWKFIYGKQAMLMYYIHYHHYYSYYYVEEL